MKQLLVQRRCNELVAAGNHGELLAVINPFEEQDTFVSTAPKLSAIDIDTRSKLATWSEVIFSGLLVDWILLGFYGSKDIFQFCKLALERLSHISAVDLESHVAKEFGDQKDDLQSHPRALDTIMEH